jgi:hypothetical protein
VYSLLKQEPSLLTGSAILQNFQTASSGTTRETFSDIEADFSTGDLNNGRAKTNAIVPQNTIEENYKTFYESYVKQQTDTIISDADSLRLFNLAKACPFVDGSVVYQARALYNSIYMSNLLFEDNCKSDPVRAFEINKAEESSSFKVNLYPNPNPGEFTLEFDNNDTRWEIEIKDMQGRTIFKEITSNQKLSLKPSAENGVYLVHVTNILTNEKVVKKLVIQK